MGSSSPNFVRNAAPTSAGTLGLVASSPNGSPGASASTVNSTMLMPSRLGIAISKRLSRYWLTCSRSANPVVHLHDRSDQTEAISMRQTHNGPRVSGNLRATHFSSKPARSGTLLPKVVSIMTARCFCSGSAPGDRLNVVILQRVSRSQRFILYSLHRASDVHQAPRSVAILHANQAIL